MTSLRCFLTTAFGVLPPSIAARTASKSFCTCRSLRSCPPTLSRDPLPAAGSIPADRLCPPPPLASDRHVTDHGHSDPRSPGTFQTAAAPATLPRDTEQPVRCGNEIDRFGFCRSGRTDG